ncbi:MAG: hydantoinase/oxoprolinase family protein [Deltaproteobacteria bacterium]|nr:hydantoinase/oxoprolinase family protein [Deltaproteobacteria bacterium]
MLLGIDIGGTHTDAVIIDDDGIRATAKIETVHDNLVASLDAVLEKILPSGAATAIRKINLSTTLTTNAIVEKKLEEVGVLAVSGPGLAASCFNRDLGDHVYIFSGSIDHRGNLRQPLDEKAVHEALARCRESGVRVFAAVSKFSTRNPHIELTLAEMAADQSDFTTLGHRLSGRLNFPRRLATAYYNSAVWRRYNAFADAVSESIARHDLEAPLNILKADGGTIDLEHSRTHPVQTILSGPAASIMGITALCSIREDAVILDIGGTTTDIAIFADGAPLLERDGVAFGGRPTLIRAIRTRSIGIGGDSRVRLDSRGEIAIGPERLGPPLALGGPAPTLIDAANVAGISAVGNPEKSHAGLSHLAGQAAVPQTELAENILRLAADRIRRESLDLLEEINQKPAYTVAEILHAREIRPEKLYIMGGPAAILASRLGEVFALPTEVPDHFAVANAVGAALTRTTMESELFADTGRGSMIIPNLGIERRIDSTYSLSQARRDGAGELAKFLAASGHPGISAEDVGIIEAEAFNMVDDYAFGSKTIRVSCQIRPGLEKLDQQGAAIS